MRRWILAVTMASLLGSMAGATAMPTVRAGVLECQGGRNYGYVVGSIASFDCIYRSPGHRSEPYIATIRRFGLDLGVTEQTRFTWAVSAVPTSRFGRNDLSGSYGGVGANASVGVGLGGNFLVGGPGKAYALQPISVQAHTGLNVTAGLAGVELKPVLFARGAPRFRRHHFLQ